MQKVWQTKTEKSLKVQQTVLYQRMPTKYFLLYLL
jgi:hypothetical protein